MKAITSNLSLAALLGVLVVLPGCGGDEAAPEPDNGMPTATDPVVQSETGEVENTDSDTGVLQDIDGGTDAGADLETP